MSLPADFSKIFGSTATGGLTPISDVNYAKGWEFVGANPPTKNDFTFLQYQSDLKAKWLYDNNVGRLLNIQTISASGNYTPTPGTRRIKVTITGGGASGGKSATSGSYARSGGAGGTAIAWMDAPDSPVAVTIGGGGAGVNAPGSLGVPGGNSTFGSLTTAFGGTTESLGGGASGNGIYIFGGNGNHGSSLSNNTFGGASYWGGGGAGYSSPAPASLGAKAYGAGGAGVDVNGSASGNGAPGICMIEEYS